jgi:hypothetical protein
MSRLPEFCGNDDDHTEHEWTDKHERDFRCPGRQDGYVLWELTLTSSTARMIPALWCDWGTKVSLPHDASPCHEQARHRVVLHDEPYELHLRVCGMHHLVIERETNPHNTPPTHQHTQPQTQPT